MKAFGEWGNDAYTLTSEGVIFNMGFPEMDYKFESPFATLERTTDEYKGKYSPEDYGKWKIELMFFEPGEYLSVEVNGAETDYERTDNGIVFYGEGGGDKPLQWSAKNYYR